MFLICRVRTVLIDLLSSWTFRTIVVADVVVVAITIVFAIGFVVLILVRHQVVHREAIMAGDEVDAAKRWPSIMFIQIAAAGQSSRQTRQAFPNRRAKNHARRHGNDRSIRPSDGCRTIRLGMHRPRPTLRR